MSRYQVQEVHFQDGGYVLQVLVPDGARSVAFFAPPQKVNAVEVARELNVLWAMVQYLASAPQQLQALGQDACIAAAREWAEVVEEEAQA